MIDERTAFRHNINIIPKCCIVEIAEIPRMHDVIGIDKSDILAACLAETGISCRPRAAILCLMEDAHVRMHAIEFFAERTAAIRRSIIDKNDFLVRQVLREDAVDAPLQVIPLVVDGHDDRYRDHAIPFYLSAKSGRPAVRFLDSVMK